MPSLWYRLFHVGRMPAHLAALAADADLLGSAEGVSMKFSSTGLRLPGRYTSRGVRLHSGALVVTRDRIALSVGRQVALDASYGTAPTPLSFTISAEQVQLHLDVGAAVPPRGAGTLTITVRARLAVQSSDVRYVTVSPVEATTLARWA